MCVQKYSSHNVLFRKFCDIIKFGYKWDMNYWKQTYFYITLKQSKYNPYIVSILQFKTWPPNTLGNCTSIYVISEVLEVVNFIHLYTIMNNKVRTLAFLTQFIVFIDYHWHWNQMYQRLHISQLHLLIFLQIKLIYIYIFVQMKIQLWSLLETHI